MFKPEFDWRSMVTGAAGVAALAMVTYAAVRFSKWFWHGERWWFKVGRWFKGVVISALKGVFTEALKPIMSPQKEEIKYEFAQMRAQLKNLSDENAAAHSEVAQRLDAHGERLDAVDKRLDNIEAKAEERAKQFRSTDPPEE